jgi:hypothetical protein
MNALCFEWIEPWLCRSKAKRAARRLFLRSGVAKLIASYHAQGNRDAVFLWIPKNAGTSFYALLAKHGCIKYKTADSVRFAFPQRGLVTFCHMSYPALINNNFVSKKFDQEAFKFCFARNPYDRAVSLWQYSMKTQQIDSRISFETFCNILKDGAFERPGLFNSSGLSQCSPQVDWITDDKDQNIADYIGKVENFENDSKTILAELGISGDILHLNRSKELSVSDCYTSKTRSIIAKVYETDLDFFRYSFPV